MKVYVVTSSPCFSPRGSGIGGGHTVHKIFKDKKTAEKYVKEARREQYEFSKQCGSNAGARGYKLTEQEIE